VSPSSSPGPLRESRKRDEQPARRKQAGQRAEAHRQRARRHEMRERVAQAERRTEGTREHEARALQRRHDHRRARAESLAGAPGDLRVGLETHGRQAPVAQQLQVSAAAAARVEHAPRAGGAQALAQEAGLRLAHGKELIVVRRQAPVDVHAPTVVPRRRPL